MYMCNFLCRILKSNLVRKKNEVVVQEGSPTMQWGDTVSPKLLWAVCHCMKSQCLYSSVFPTWNGFSPLLKAQLKSNLFPEVSWELYLGIFFFSPYNISLLSVFSITHLALQHPLKYIYILFPWLITCSLWTRNSGLYSFHPYSNLCQCYPCITRTAWVFDHTIASEILQLYCEGAQEATFLTCCPGDFYAL